MHELLTQWVMKYMELEKSRSADANSLKALIKE